MKAKISPLDVAFSSPGIGKSPPWFICDNEHINSWFKSDAHEEHRLFNSSLTYVYIDGDPELAGLFALSIKRENQSEFSGYNLIRDAIFIEDKITTVHIQWLAVRVDLMRRGLASIIMPEIIDKTYHVITRVGAAALTVKYMNNASLHLYEKFGFVGYGQAVERRLYLPSQAIIDTVASVSS